MSVIYTVFINIIYMGIHPVGKVLFILHTPRQILRRLGITHLFSSMFQCILKFRNIYVVKFLIITAVTYYTNHYCLYTFRCATDIRKRHIFYRFQFVLKIIFLMNPFWNNWLIKIIWIIIWFKYFWIARTVGLFYYNPM